MSHTWESVRGTWSSQTAMRRGSRALVLYILLACSVAFSGAALNVKPTTGLHSGTGEVGTHIALDTSSTRLFHLASVNRTVQLKIFGCLGIITPTFTRTFLMVNGLYHRSGGFGGFGHWESGCGEDGAGHGPLWLWGSVHLTTYVVIRNSNRTYVEHQNTIAWETLIHVQNATYANKNWMTVRTGK